MKKTLLAIAVTALSANAFAANLDYTAATAPAANTIAKEVVTTTAALTTTDIISWKLGFSVTNQNLVRIDLSNGAKFTAAPALYVDVTAAGATAGGTLATVAAGGAGQSFVVFQVANGATVQFDKIAVLQLAGLTTASQSDIAVQYRLYSAQADAANGTANTIAAATFPYATFANGLVFGADTAAVAASKQIDVTQASKKFTNTTLVSNPFGGLNLSVKTNTYGADLTAPALTLTDLVGANASITVSGDFSAISTTPANTLLAALPATIDATKTKATFALGAVPAALNSAKLTYAVNGTTAIAPASYSAKINLGTGAKLTAAPADVAGFANLAKNGATAEVDLALKPGGVYSNFLRISNKSGIAGDVFITVINDAGQSATVSLGEVKGQTSNSLNAGASTTQLAIADVFAAAATKGLALANEGKLRLVVEAQIAESKLSVQSYTVAKDGNSFATF
ncbi:hypothetical protein [Stutzerimonas kunmingensis]|jgi:hypothetical protein|uniref:hypothetical protein n=1 Tax=Stutzerimonas kunmingensis TaxID=1211807 RepID=UPI00241C5204|nr:hypothetical protein [Stutzerimonas kunmingensis]|tara:strand:- start:14303 stop:15667 length:1365 start_codon:yes stop_codon:yes gene_type:complete